jgi:putative transposase
MGLVAGAESIRKRMRRREHEGGSRFLTFSCYERLPLLKNPAIADLMSVTISRARQRFGFKLYAWVVMPEHVHILLRPGEAAEVARVLLWIKYSVARRVIARWREMDAPVLGRLTRETGPPRFWQKGGGFDRNVRSETEFCKEVRYIHRNPVERGLVATPRDWRWSSARWWSGVREGEIECDAPPGDPRSWAVWEGYL